MKIVEDLASIAIQLLHFLRDTGFTLGDEPNDIARETSQTSDILWTAAVILIEIPSDPAVTHTALPSGSGKTILRAVTDAENRNAKTLAIHRIKRL